MERSMISDRIAMIETMNDSIVISAPILGKILRLLYNSHQRPLMEEAFQNMMGLNDLSMVLSNPVTADNYDDNTPILGYTKFKDKVLYRQ